MENLYQDTFQYLKYHLNKLQVLYDWDKDGDNILLRYERGMENKDDKYIVNQLNQIFNEIETDEDIIVYRGESIDLYQNLKIGQSISYSPFLSVTPDINSIKSYHVLIKIRVPAGVKAIYVSAWHEFENSKIEREEILLPKGQLIYQGGINFKYVPL